jgi:hypothetical protein
MTRKLIFAFMALSFVVSADDPVPIDGDPCSLLKYCPSGPSVPCPQAGPPWC